MLLQEAGMTLSNKFMHSTIKGVTLIELLITLVVITIGMAALIKFQGTYFYYADLSKQQAEATVLAKTKMADLRNFQVLTTTPGYNAYSDIISGSSATIGSNATYTTTWTVTTNTSPAYKTINMIVSWLDRRGTTKNVNLTSIISQIDPETSGALIYG